MKKITLLANLLLVFSLLTLTFSCNKDDEIKEDDAVQEFLFKISFSNDWLCSECGEATLFISDENGLLLAEKSWIGNASLEFPLPNGVNKDQSISISIIHSRPSEQLYVYSYDQVPI